MITSHTNNFFTQIQETRYEETENDSKSPNDGPTGPESDE